MNIFSGLSTDEANEFMEKRNEKYIKDTDLYKCPGCGSAIMQTTLFISIHDQRFSGMCAGGGEVQKINYAYCPQCEPDIPNETLRACVHC